MVFGDQAPILTAFGGWVIADIIATVFRFRQFLLEFGPLFLASWVGLAVVFGLITVLSKHKSCPSQQGETSLRMPISVELYHNLARWLWRLFGRNLEGQPLSVLLIFGLSAAMPALVATSLIGLEAFSWRLILAAAYAMILGWFISRLILRQAAGNSEIVSGRQDSSQPTISPGETRPSPSAKGVRTFARVSWRSFTSQLDEALLPVLIGFALASALTIYVPAYWLRPLLSETAWFGPYLAAALVIPFQLSRGAEVPVAAALLVKGANLGVALSVMLAVPSTTVAVILWLRRSAGVARATLYLLVAWLVAGSLGVIVNLAQSLFAGGA